MCNFLKKEVNFSKSARRQRFCRWIGNYISQGALRDFRGVSARKRVFRQIKSP